MLYKVFFQEHGKLKMVKTEAKNAKDAEHKVTRTILEYRDVTIMYAIENMK